MRNKWKKWLALCTAVIFGTLMLQGCAGMQSPEKMLESMKEFSTEDGTASIYLNENWTVEDLGVDYWLCAGNSLGNQVFIMMQSPKNGFDGFASNMEELKELFKESYSFLGESAEAPEIPLMTGVTAQQGQMNTDLGTIDGYAVFGETDYAYYALLFGADNMNDSFLASAKVSCSQFQENVPEEVDYTTAELTDTVRWFNASYAVLTDLNGWDYNRFGGLPANEESKAAVQQLLVEWWDVTDRASADETLDWILSEGHRVGFRDDIGILEDAGIGSVSAQDRISFLKSEFGLDEASAQFYADMYDMYLECGETAIDGWDYCRALNLLGYYYVAGYYTEKEALDTSLEIALAVQPEFTSWDELIESYMRGYVYWAEESADDRRAVYEELKTRSDNPYAVDYNTALEKTW